MLQLQEYLVVFEVQDSLEKLIIPYNNYSNMVGFFLRWCKRRHVWEYLNTQKQIALVVAWKAFLNCSST